MTSLLKTVLLSIGVIVVLIPLQVVAGPSGWLHQRSQNNYRAVEQWSEFPDWATGPNYARNPFDTSDESECVWNLDHEISQTWSDGTLAPGASFSFDECFLSDGVERVNQASASDQHGNPLQVTVTATNPYHTRSASAFGDICLVGPAYPHLQQGDHTSPYASFVPGSAVGLDDGGWAVMTTTVTVTVTNTTNRTVRRVGISALLGRPYAWAPPLRPPSCQNLTLIPAQGYEPQWRTP